MHGRTGAGKFAIALLSSLVLTAACGGVDGGGNGGVVAPDPVPAAELDRLRLGDGPEPTLIPDRADGAEPTYLVAALGTDEVLAATWDGVRPGAFFVGSVSDGTWEPIDPPPVPGELRAEVATVGHDVVLAGAVCAGQIDLEAEDQPPCPAGYEGLGIWRLDHRTHDWHRVSVVPPAELELFGSTTGVTTDEQWSSTLVGVVGDAVAFVVGGGLVRLVTVDMGGEVDIPYRWDPAGDARHIQFSCVTGSGAMVGTARRIGFADAPVTVHLPGAVGWTHLQGVTVGDIQSIGCGYDRFSIVGEVEDEPGVAEWRVVDLTGRTVADEPLPVDAVLRPGLGGQTLDGFTRSRQHYPAPGRNDPGVVRDFGHHEDIDWVNYAQFGDEPVGAFLPPADEYGLPVLLPRKVVVLPRPGAAALVQVFPEDQEVIVEGTTTLPDGRIVSLVHRRTNWEAGDDSFRLLIAE